MQPTSISNINLLEQLNQLNQLNNNNNNINNNNNHNHYYNRNQHHITNNFNAINLLNSLTSSNNQTDSNYGSPSPCAAPNNLCPNSFQTEHGISITGSPIDAPADCTIAAEKGHITAHKLVLCAHSKYLRDILSKYPTAKHPIIILTELNITDIMILVGYMYTGELVITSDASTSSLLQAAQILEIDSLTSPSPYRDNDDVDDTINDIDDTIDDVDDNINDVDDGDVDTNFDNKQAIDIQAITNFESDNNNNNNHNDSLNSTNTSSSSHNQTIKQTESHKHSKIRCHLCNIGLSDVKCLYRHVLTRHLPEKWGYKCEFCDREFSRDDHLMRHYTTKHKNMEFNREKIREIRRLNREMAKNFHDQMSTA